MELYDVMRTTFAAREFTGDPVPDEALFKILDRARFAPSGGNRQGWRVIVVRDPATKAAARRAERSRRPSATPPRWRPGRTRGTASIRPR